MTMLENKTPLSGADEEWHAGPLSMQQKKRDIRDILADIEIFSDLTPEDCDKVGRMLHHRTYLPDEVIVRQGAPGVGMYIIEFGSADVVLGTPDGREIHLATLGEQQFFGEMSLLDGSPRAASVVAAERTRALGFFSADLMGLMEHSPRLGFKIAWRLMGIMSRRLNETLGDYRDATRVLRQLQKEAQKETA